MEIAMEESMELLFSDVTLGRIHLENRIIMAPMTRSRATPDGIPSELAVEYYGQRAGAGMIITEGTQPSYQGQGYCRTPGIHTSAQVEGWKKITDAVHRRGSKISLQIMHVGRIGHRLNQFEKTGFVAPSAINAGVDMFTDQEGMVPVETPREATAEDIDNLKKEHRLAVSNAFDAGFDGVELHGANGYLGQQFLSSGSNRREDDYGGTVEKRCRFVIEVLQAMAEVDGGDRIGVRFSPGGEFNGIIDEDPGETYTTLLSLLQPLDLAWVHFMHTGWQQETLYSLVTAPLILTGGYDGEKAARALNEAGAAAIGFGTSFLANPDLPVRIRKKLPLNEADRGTFFSPGPEGYIDYPEWQS